MIVKTSNAGGDVQDVELTDGRPIWHHVASLVAEWGEDTRRRGRALVGRRRRRRDASARGRRRAPADAAGGAAAARRRRAGRRRRRSRRARSRAVPPARSSLPRARSTTPSARRATTSARQPAPRRRGSSRRSGPRPAGSAAATEWRRYAAPGGVPARRHDRRRAVRSGLEHGSGEPARRPRRRTAHTTVVTHGATTTANERRVLDGAGGRHFGVISTKTGVPVARHPAAEPEGDARRRSSSARRSGSSETARCSSWRSRCVARGAGARAARRRCNARAYVIEDARTGEMLASSNAHERAPDRVDHEADDGAAHARAPQAHGRRHRRSARRGRRRVVDRARRRRAADRPRPDQGRADPVGERRGRRARALDRARLPVVREADERARPRRSGCATRTSSVPTGSTRRASTRARPT